MLEWLDPYFNRHIGYITRIISKDGAPVRSNGSLIGLNETFITGMTGSGPQTAMLVTPVAPEYLRLVQGFQDCGVVEVLRSDLSNVDDVRNLLSTKLFKAGTADSQRTDLGMPATQPATVVEDLASSWPSARQSKDDAGHLLEMHVYRIDLYSKFAEGLVVSESLADTILLFRWSKVHAVYGQLGSAGWAPALDDILKEAEFRAGDGLKLSILGVSEERWDRYRLSGSSEME
jgi:hypothetical protein